MIDFTPPAHFSSAPFGQSSLLRWESGRKEEQSPKYQLGYLVVFNCPVIQGLDGCLKSVPEAVSQTLKQQKTLGFPEQKGLVIR